MLDDMREDMDKFLAHAERRFDSQYPGFDGALGLDGLYDRNRVIVKRSVVDDIGFLTVTVAGWSDTRISIAFDPDMAEVRITGVLREVRISKRIPWKESSVLGGDLFGDVLRYLSTALPAPEFQYKVVAEGGVEVFNDVKSLLRKYRSRGMHRSPGTRPELQNQPKLEGLLGPMYDGRKGDVSIIRYEDAETYRQLSI